MKGYDPSCREIEPQWILIERPCGHRNDAVLFILTASGKNGREMLEGRASRCLWRVENAAVLD